MTGLNGESRWLGEMLQEKGHVFVRAPIKLVSEANQREHHMARYRRKCQQQKDMMLALSPFKVRPQLPATVTITRLGPKLLDQGNLAGACKHVEDAIAKYMGCGDGPSDPIRWSYEQRVIKGGYGVEVEIRGA